MSAKDWAKFCLVVICVLCAFVLMMAGKDEWKWLFLVTILISGDRHD